jgi:hypothetical protein
MRADPEAHSRSVQASNIREVLLWLEPQLSPQARTPDNQMAPSTPRKPRLLSSPGSPHSPNGPGSNQVRPKTGIYQHSEEAFQESLPGTYCLFLFTVASLH